MDYCSRLYSCSACFCASTFSCRLAVASLLLFLCKITDPLLVDAKDSKTYKNRQLVVTSLKPVEDILLAHGQKWSSFPVRGLHLIYHHRSMEARWNVCVVLIFVSSDSVLNPPKRLFFYAQFLIAIGFLRRLTPWDLLHVWNPFLIPHEQKQNFSLV